MTTIAYRNGKMAADTGCGGQYSRIGRVQKIVRNQKGDMGGAAGYTSYMRAFQQWFLDGDQFSANRPPQAKDDSGGADIGLIVRVDGSIEYYDSSGWHLISAPYVAIGSGAAEARGAMFAGADAEMAGRAAMEHDAHTFGKITVLHRDEPSAAVA